MVKFIFILVLACVLAVNANETQVTAVFDVRLNASMKCSILTGLTVDSLLGAPVTFALTVNTNLHVLSSKAYVVHKYQAAVVPLT